MTALSRVLHDSFQHAASRKYLEDQSRAQSHTSCALAGLRQPKRAPTPGVSGGLPTAPCDTTLDRNPGQIPVGLLERGDEGFSVQQGMLQLKLYEVCLFIQPQHILLMLSDSLPTQPPLAICLHKFTVDSACASLAATSCLGRIIAGPGTWPRSPQNP